MFDGVHIGHQALVRELMGQENLTFKQAINEAVRRGLGVARSSERRRARTPTRRMGQPTVSLDAALRLAGELKASAKLAGASALAATFDPLPIQVLAPGAPASALSDVADRVRRLRAAGADAVVVFHFDERFSKLGADEFIDRMRAAGDVRRILVGPDFHFGNRAEGDVDKLRDRGQHEGFVCDVMPPVPSTTNRIRSASSIPIRICVSISSDRSPTSTIPIPPVSTSSK